MERLEIEKNYKGSLNSLLQEYPDILRLGYVVPEYIYKRSILFVGLNPSLGPEKKDGVRVFYDLNARDKSNHYFDKFFEIGDHCNHVWFHLDLFLIRETYQNNIRAWCKDERFKESMVKQFALTREIISQAAPKVIVVCNTMAREWFRNKLVNPLAYDVAFDDSLGTYRIINDEALMNVPVFFRVCFLDSVRLIWGRWKDLYGILRKLLGNDVVIRYLIEYTCKPNFRLDLNI